MTQNMELNWKKENSYFNFEVKVDNALGNENWFTGNLLCNKCQTQVKQKYICPECGQEHTIGEITHRKDSKSDLVFSTEQLDAFVKNERTDTITVIGEIPKQLVLNRLELLDNHYELYTNDPKKIPVMSKIHQYLLKYDKALLITFGLNTSKSAKIGGIITPGKDRLLIHSLRDQRFVKPAKQEGLQQLETLPEEQHLEAISINLYNDLIKKFLELIKKGETIEVIQQAKPKREEEPIELSVLD